MPPGWIRCHCLSRYHCCYPSSISPNFKVKAALSSAARESHCCRDLLFHLAVRLGKKAVREGRPLARPAGQDYRSCIHQDM